MWEDSDRLEPERRHSSWWFVGRESDSWPLVKIHLYCVLALRSATREVECDRELRVEADARKEYNTAN